MNFSALFIRRPVATTLLTLGIALAGLAAFFQLPVAPLPQVDFPTIVGQRADGGREPGNDGDDRGDPARTPSRGHRRCHRDDLVEHGRLDPHHAAIRAQPRHRGRRARRAGRDQRRARRPAASLRTNPTYRKVNPADAPILILSLTSDTRTRGQIYDAASMVLQPALSQIDGVGQVTIGGGARRAVRVELEPARRCSNTASASRTCAPRSPRPTPTARKARSRTATGAGSFTPTTRPTAPDDYKPLVIAYRNGAPVRLSDVAKVEEGQENMRNTGSVERQAGGAGHSLPAAGRQHHRRRRPRDGDAAAARGRRCRATIDLDRGDGPHARRSAPRCTRSSVTLVIAVGLVILVVFLFLRNARAALIPSVAVPVSLLGTFGAMYLLGYSLNNLSLMALTIATGFVVDDAIVVLENVTRHIEAGMPRMRGGAARRARGRLHGRCR